MTIKTHSDTHIAKKRWYIERVWGAAKEEKIFHGLLPAAAIFQFRPTQSVWKNICPFLFFGFCVYLCGGLGYRPTYILFTLVADGFLKSC
jgi:hypothetical protein